LAHLFAVLFSHIHSLCGVEHLIGIDFITDVGHLRKTIGSSVKVGEGFFNTDGSRNTVADDAVRQSHTVGIKTGHRLSDVGKSVTALVFFSNKVCRQTCSVVINQLSRSPGRDVHDLTEGLCQAFHLKGKLSVVEVGAGIDINGRLAGSHFV